MGSGKPSLIRRIILSLFIGSLIMMLSIHEIQADPFKVGTGVVDVTPPIGYPHYEGISTGIKDPIYAKALVFKQGSVQGTLLICNLLNIPRDLSRIVREEVWKETGIPFQFISVTATHSHTGPSFAQPLLQYAARRGAGKLTEEDQNGYIAFLIRGMKEAVILANKQVKEVAMKTGIGEAKGISFNRRFLMRSGRIVMNPGRMNPDIIQPAGPIDTDVHFVLFRPVSGTTYNASLSVFASHYARGGTQFSSDYPFYLEQRLRQFFGEQLVSVFGTGTCGNINTVDVSRATDNTDGTPAGTEWVGIVGNKLADGIKMAVPATEQKNPSLKIQSKVIHLPLQSYTAEELEWAKKQGDTSSYYPDRPWLTRFRRSKILSLEQLRQHEAIAPPVSGEPWMLPLEIHVFKLDAQTAIVTLPGEVFVEHGLELKKRSHFANTLVIELANSGIGYVPDRDAFIQGDYEAINSRLIPGSGEKMVEVAVQMLNKLKVP